MHAAHQHLRLPLDYAFRMSIFRINSPAEGCPVLGVVKHLQIWGPRLSEQASLPKV